MGGILMKPFDVELAKKGHPVCTRDGRPARIICFDRMVKRYPIIALLKDGDEEIIRGFTSEGRFSSEYFESKEDLMMAPTKREGWINIYPSVSEFACATSMGHKTKEEAIANKREDCIATVKIEWEV